MSIGQQRISNFGDADYEPSAWAKRQPTDGSFQVAGMTGWWARRAMQANPQIERNFRSTILGIVGPGFTAEELNTLQERALDTAEPKDVVLKDIKAGVPVDITRAQRSRIDLMVDRLGDDELGRRAREAYREALKSGKIRER